ncbi:MAG: DUF1513 domain-containing protein [Rhizobiales bacterium]|nr:DUF1513 domain-containing protein [Hyphomicrobiales bacterium]
MINRRTLLKTAAKHALLLPAIAMSNQLAHASADVLKNFMLCAKNPDGDFVGIKLNEKGIISQQFKLQERGHGQAVSILGDIAIFARRPNNQLYLIDRMGRLKVHYAPEGRHFFGHGVFSNDGKLLYCSENDYDNEDVHKTGVIGVWDVIKGAKIGEFLSGGIGVHEIKLMPDGETLAIANGGILTHPDQPRRKLNLASMRPNLSFVNRKTGDLITSISLPKALHQLSIRHIDVSNHSEVAVAMQYKGNKNDDVPLVAIATKYAKLKFVNMPQQILKHNRQYIGSIAFDKSGKYFAATSPRGHQVCFYNRDGEYISQYKMDDICAITATKNANEFIFASGMGHIRSFNVDNLQLKNIHIQTAKMPLLQWDNHMTLL